MNQKKEYLIKADLTTKCWYLLQLLKVYTKRIQANRAGDLILLGI